MRLDRWFPDGPTWHAHDDSGEGQHALCGLRLVELDESSLVQATESSPYPPTPCPKCLYIVAMDDVEEESLEHARGRGYLPAPD